MEGTAEADSSIAEPTTDTTSEENGGPDAGTDAADTQPADLPPIDPAAENDAAAVIEEPVAACEEVCFRQLSCSSRPSWTDEMKAGTSI